MKMPGLIYEDKFFKTSNLEVDLIWFLLLFFFFFIVMAFKPKSMHEKLI